MNVPIQLPANQSDYFYILLRFVHLAAGITWVGMLYFFNLVNVPFMKEVEAGMKPAIFKGMTLRALWWFRWGSVLTVLAGLIYWMIMAGAEARYAHASIGRLHGSFFGIWIAVFVIQYALIMVVKIDKGFVLAGLVGILVVIASWLFLSINSVPGISNRTLAIGVGGGMGLIMMLNVWGIIWRAQKRIINGALSGTPAINASLLARQAFLASRTNFFLSFPMLFFMAIASHFPIFGV